MAHDARFDVGVPYKPLRNDAMRRGYVAVVAGVCDTPLRNDVRCGCTLFCIAFNAL